MRTWKRRAWIPRAKGRPLNAPNATEARYRHDIIWPYPPAAVTYQPKPLIITRVRKRKYTADYLITLPDGTREYHEVKGSYHLPTHDRARLAWEVAAEANPDCVFVWAELTRRGWEIERWSNGGDRIAVRMAGATEYVVTDGEWRRHKPRSKKHGK